MEEIACNNISVTFKNFFKRFQALDGVSFKVNKGDVFGFLGPNGAGKTTTMNCLLGMLYPNTGSVEILGKKPAPGSEIFSRVSYLPEIPLYPSYLTVFEAIRYFADMSGKDISDKTIDEYLEKFQLEKYRDFLIKKCSKGMTQKVGIIQSIISRPEILFLDEPTRGLDPVTVKVMREALLDLNKEGTTIFLNSHVIAEVEMICNRIAVINRGKVIREESVEDFKRGDHEGYTVKFETSSKIPDYIEIISDTSPIFTGEIKDDAIFEFMKFLEKGRSKLISCNLKAKSLEEALFDLLEKE